MSYDQPENFVDRTSDPEKANLVDGYLPEQNQEIQCVLDRLHVSFSNQSNEGTLHFVMDQYIDPDCLDDCRLTLSNILRFCDVVHDRLEEYPQSRLVVRCGLLVACYQGCKPPQSSCSGAT